MQNYHDQAVAAWPKYGRIDARGRVYLAGEYIGRIGHDDAGQPMSFCVGDRRVGYCGVDLISLTAAYLMR